MQRASDQQTGHETYRAELDTLRAVAVVLVLASHWIPGFAANIHWGVVGVYLFFVISGYVITRGLLRERDGPSGRIDFLRFYARRTLRIWPIYFLALAAMYWLWPGLREGSVIWHVTFLSNVLFSFQDAPKFPIHLWSLSVEEQFYLLWPALMAWQRRHLEKICVALIVLGVLSRWYFAGYLGQSAAA